MHICNDNLYRELIQTYFQANISVGNMLICRQIKSNAVQRLAFVIYRINSNMKVTVNSNLGADWGTDCMAPKQVVSGMTAAHTGLGNCSTHQN